MSRDKNHPVVLVVEDNPITLKMLHVALEAEGFHVLKAPDGRTALSLLEAEHPALVIQDYVLPDMTGTDLVRQIRASPHGRGIPVILLTGLTSQLEELQAEALFSAVLQKPLQPTRLADVARGLLAGDQPRAVTKRARHVLVVDDEPLNRKLAEIQLAQAGFRTTAVGTVEEALKQARRARPDVILSDVMMPGLDGFQLCLAARRDTALAEVPIVLVSGAYAEEADRELARKVGAADLVFRSPGLVREIAAIRDALDRGVPSAAPIAVALEPEYWASLRRQMDRQLAANQALAESAAIQAAALSMIGALALALARPRDVPAVLGDVLVHCLDAAGLSTGLLYLREADGSLRLHSVAGLTDLPRGRVEAAFDHTELLAPRGEGAPLTAFTTTTATSEAERAFLLELGSGSALVVPFVVADRHYGSLVLASETHDLSEPAWGTFGKTLAVQFGQAMALGQAIGSMADSEELFHTAVHASPSGMIMVDPNGRIVLANPQIRAIFGYHEQEIVGQPVERLLLAPQREVHQGHRATFLKSPESRLMGAGRELFGLHKDGRQIPVEIGLAPVQRRGGTFVLASVMDITERKRAEEALRASEAHIRAVLENIADGVLVLDQAGRHLDANPRACELTGYNREELLQLTTADTHLPADRAAAAGRIAQVTGGEPVSVEREMLRKDGSVIIIESQAKRMPDGRLLATIRDVTERRRLEQQLVQAQKMEAVGRLAGGVAHDFNNILTAVIGYADLLAEELPPSSTARSDLQEIQNAAKRAEVLTRQLLAFSRQQVLQPAVLDLNDVVENLEKMLHRILGEDVELETTLAPDLGNVKADPGQIEQVILNLAVNARDAMPTGGKLTIETANAELDETYPRAHAGVSPGQYVMLAVSDKGTGMDEATKARIFEPFFTTKAEKGTGLGLATVHGIVNQSGGHIQVYSEPGHGATFKVYLPRVDAPVEAFHPAPAGPTLAGHETVLLAEDDESLRSLARTLLMKLGYTVLEARNADDALAVARDHRGDIHLLLSDVVMPGQSGPQLAGGLLEHRPGLRVLYMSGYTDEAIIRHGLLERGLNYLQKPFTPAALARKVREVLDAPAATPPSPRD